MLRPDPAKAWLVQALSRYWPRNAGLLHRIECASANTPAVQPLPPYLEPIRLPGWAEDVGVDGCLLVPTFAVCGGEGEPWRRVDWWAAAFWYLNGSAERAAEAGRGPIHSYSFLLRGWGPRLWERAWVNRIALFLRRRAARQQGAPEEQLFGPLPEAELVVTHDVDAVRKTVAIRAKQSAFHAFNAVRSLAAGRPAAALAKLSAAVRFALAPADYWACLERVVRLEEEAGVLGHFNVYAGPGGPRSPKQMLLDPSYDPREGRLRRRFRELQAAGWTVGLHQSFDCWHDAARMAEERRRLEAALGLPVTTCRQHWLRFSWDRTWRAQQAAGLACDMTLGFNNRPGFRAGAALAWRPWDPEAGRPLTITVMPLVLMDSHLYDYARLDDEARHEWIAHWVGEVRTVRGVATFLWHPHTLGSDYGWGEGFRWLLDEIARPRPASRAA